MLVFLPRQSVRLTGCPAEDQEGSVELMGGAPFLDEVVFMYRGCSVEVRGSSAS